jgi:SAM-dependent methyltransferase
MVLTPPASVVWHDLECGLYRADLPLWRELAHEHADGPLLDVGAGSGRVSLDLARAGHRVIALDLEPELLAALDGRARGLAVETVCADARSFSLNTDGLRLCLAPMQTIQLLGGRDGRIAFLERARAHLRPGGVLACAIVTDVEPFDCTDGSAGPSAERVLQDEQLYESQATSLQVLDGRIVIERRRKVHPLDSSELDVVELDVLSARQLESEGRMVGFRVEPAREIPATADYTGSAVVMLRA